ncbi:MAG: hypothetical protein V4710_01495, partial [Verrucomicrobiota bacterium]
MRKNAHDHTKMPMSILLLIAFIFVGSQARVNAASTRNDSFSQPHCRGKAAEPEPGNCRVEIIARKIFKDIPLQMFLWEAGESGLALRFQEVCGWAG